MKLYRAVPRQKAPSSQELHARSTTLRAPSNVPYVVDNLWEAFRPDNMPSRRHAVYASPTPELALANASSLTTTDRAAYAVFEVQIQGSATLAHLDISDARHHADVRLLPKIILEILGKDFSLLPLQERLAVAPLFMPYMRRDELLALALHSPLLQECLDKAEQVSTFWPNARPHPCADRAGELFFELAQGSTYRLVPVA